MINQKDIARELNVSASLVSKVLSNRLGTSRVSPGTVEAIRRRAAEKKYRKNGPAVALATGRQGVVGVFIHRIGLAGSNLTEAVLEGISVGALAEGQRMMLQFFETTAAFRAWGSQFQPTLLDGIIVVGYPHSDLRDDLLQIQSRGVRVITIFDEAMAPTLLNVGLDQREVERMATAHLIERGCRRIAHIVAKDSRRMGYEDALDAAGIPRRPELVFAPPPSPASSFDAEAGRLAVAHFVSHGIEFDGLAAQSDHQAAGAINALLTMGRRVPEDVKVVGVDDSPLCSLVAVPLSSVSQVFRQRGLIAMQAMMQPASDNDIVLPEIRPVLQARESSAVKLAAAVEAKD